MQKEINYHEEAEMQALCDFCCRVMPEYIADTLDSESGRKVMGHLQECASCQEEYQCLSAMQQILPPVPELPQNFTETLHQRLTEAAAEMQPTAETVPGGKRIRFPKIEKKHLRVLIAAAACVALTVGVFTTGLYQQWMSADSIWDKVVVEESEKPKTTENPQSTRETDEALPQQEGTGLVDVEPKTVQSSDAAGASKAKKEETSVKEQPSKSEKPKPTPTVRPSKTAAPKSTVQSQQEVEQRGEKLISETTKPTQTPVQEPTEEKAAMVSEQEPEVQEQQKVPPETEEAVPQAALMLDAEEAEENGRATRHSGGGGGNAASKAGEMETEEVENSRKSKRTIYQISVGDVETFLENCREETGLAWRSRQTGSGSAYISGSGGVALRLSLGEWNRLSGYASAKGYTPDLYEEGQNQGEVLVVITE